MKEKLIIWEEGYYMDGTYITSCLLGQKEQPTNAIHIFLKRSWAIRSGECGAIKSKDETFYEFTSQLLMYFSRDDVYTIFLLRNSSSMLSARAPISADCWFLCKLFFMGAPQPAREEIDGAARPTFCPESCSLLHVGRRQRFWCVFSHLLHINITLFYIRNFLSSACAPLFAGAIAN